MATTTVHAEQLSLSFAVVVVGFARAALNWWQNGKRHFNWLLWAHECSVPCAMPTHSAHYAHIRVARYSSEPHPGHGLSRKENGTLWTQSAVSNGRNHADSLGRWRSVDTKFHRRGIFSCYFLYCSSVSKCVKFVSILVNSCQFVSIRVDGFHFSLVCGFWPFFCDCVWFFSFRCPLSKHENLRAPIWQFFAKWKRERMFWMCLQPLETSLTCMLCDNERQRTHWICHTCLSRTHHHRMENHCQYVSQSQKYYRIIELPFVHLAQYSKFSHISCAKANEVVSPLCQRRMHRFNATISSKAMASNVVAYSTMWRRSSDAIE